MRLVLTLGLLLMGIGGIPLADAVIVEFDPACCPTSTLDPLERCDVLERATDCLPPTTRLPPGGPGEVTQ